MTITAGARRFACLGCGDGDRLALCVHGFPDDAGSMLGIVRALADAGFTAIAPYLRGYGQSDPDPAGNYDLVGLGDDLIALTRALGRERAVLIGHDWGAVASYTAATMAPAVFPRIVTLAVPPLAVFLRGLAASAAQRRRSWYMARFQLPDAAARLRRNDFALIDRLWCDWSPGWQAPPERLAEVKRTFRHSTTVDAAIAYYRQLLPRRPWRYPRALRVGLQPPRVATLILAGVEDGCVGAELYQAPRLTANPACRIDLIEGAGHFLHLERPNRVEAAILEHLCAPG